MPYYYYLTSLLLFSLALYSAAHALLHKTDSRAAFGWIAVSFLFPLFGPILYFLFGVNRVQARAKKLDNTPPKLDSFSKHFQIDIPDSLRNLQHITYQLTKLPLTGGNTIEVLFSGKETYPAMLESIHSAKKCIYLSTYIFKVDELGARFIDALIHANNRNVDVRVLIDGVGEYYSIAKARNTLSKYGVKVERFLPPKLFPFNMQVNLRNHRKLLVIDDETCFVGGMNISGEYMSSEMTSLDDLHFKITGDLTCQIRDLFESDWHFVKGDNYDKTSDDCQMVNEPAWCRTIADGPGENLGHLSILLFSAINTATKNVVIMTPYFIPVNEIKRALQVAALRGVQVSVILPIKNNLFFVKWASQHMLSQLVTAGVNIYYQPPPFDHSKIFIVDDYYCLIGSANIDPRSLRLNYEVGVEIYDQQIASKLKQHVMDTVKDSHQVKLNELENRNFLVKVRDGIAWLFSPYL